jgi:uncharacterized protein (DUF2147 family)
MKLSLQKLISFGAVLPGIALSVAALAGVLAAIGAASVLPARAADMTSAVGLWEQVDEKSGKPESWFKISEHNGVYEGNIVKMFLKPGEDENWTCEKCEGAEKGRPVLGITLIKGMQRTGMSYENGTIMDPRDGSVYSAKMKLSDDGKTLEVRGFLGLSFLGRSQYWNRLPDNALQPTPPARPAAKAAPKK